MVILTPVLFDLDGSLCLTETPGSDLYTQTRRMSKRARLDGGVSIYDGGVSEGDKTLTVVSKASESQLRHAIRMQKLYNRITISIPTGVYVGLIERVAYITPLLTLTVSIERRI